MTEFENLENLNLIQELEPEKKKFNKASREFQKQIAQRISNESDIISQRIEKLNIDSEKAKLNGTEEEFITEISDEAIQETLSEQDQNNYEVITPNVEIIYSESESLPYEKENYKEKVIDYLKRNENIILDERSKYSELDSITIKPVILPNGLTFNDITNSNKGDLKTEPVNIPESVNTPKNKPKNTVKNNDYQLSFKSTEENLKQMSKFFSKIKEMVSKIKVLPEFSENTTIEDFSKKEVSKIMLNPILSKEEPIKQQIPLNEISWLTYNLPNKKILLVEFYRTKSEVLSTKVFNNEMESRQFLDKL